MNAPTTITSAHGRVVIGTGVAVALVAALGFLWLASNRVDTTEHQTFVARLRELSQLNRVVHLDVLRARFGLINHYDRIAESERRIGVLGRELEAPSYLDSADRATVSRELGALRVALDEKHERVEAFKARNSVLKNSLRYVPTLARGMPAGDAGAQTMIELLAWDVTSDSAYRESVLASIRRVPLSPDTELFVAHVKSIATTKPAVDELVRAIVDSPVQRVTGSVEAAYQRGFAVIEGRQALSRIALYAIAIALAAAVGGTMLRLRLTARALVHANTTLEQRVADRTAALDARTKRMAVVLDNVQQGLVVVDRTGRLDEERSAIFDRWHGGGARATSLFDWVRAVDPPAAEWLTFGWTDLFEDVMPFEVVADQLPRRIGDGTRFFDLELRRINDDNGNVDCVLVVISDATDRVSRERAEADGRDLLAVIDLIIGDRAAFSEFLEEAEGLVARIRAPEADQRSQLRDLHTLKGNTALAGLSSISELCHALEDTLVEMHRLSADDLAALDRAWSSLTAKLSSIIDGDASQRTVMVESSTYRELLNDLDQLDQGQVRQRLEGLTDEPAAGRLALLAEKTRAIAMRLDKEIEVVVDADGVRLDGERMKPLWATFVHLLRNAIDHGIEPADERVAANKPARGQIVLFARAAADELVIGVRDDGPGLAWATIAQRARSRGLPADVEAQLTDALFTDSFSTKDSVTEMSGRGVGLAAVHEVVTTLGGKIDIGSAPGRGTTVEIRIPNVPRLRATYLPTRDASVA